MSREGLEACLEKMRAAGVPAATAAAFARNYELLDAGERGALPESELEPVVSVPDIAELGDDVDADALGRAVVIKLNGGLGTSMGMTRAKSLLEVKDGLSFLDIIARQVLALRKRHGVRLPLVLMNSFYTRDDTLRALERYPDLRADVPLDFVQGKVPKLAAADLTPVSWPADRSLEWAPPGHGDLYASLVSSGMLAALIDAGYEYAFVANSDNLGAVLEPRIVTWFARAGLPFAMEVTDRTVSDRKGGHIARRRGGGLVLREIAQTPDEDIDAFQDIERHRFFNTNNLWINLRSLAEVLRNHGDVIPLPMIVNRKTVDPGDPSSPDVFQLESAMGAAIGVFDGAEAIRVPRSRFAPVKTTDDLLVVRSDAYELTDGARVTLAPERDSPPAVTLDKDHFKLLRDFDQRFAHGPPSLVDCRRLGVTGDVSFGANVTVRGSVKVEVPAGEALRIDDGAVLEG